MIVLTPLISLMIDQWDKFTKKLIQAEFVGRGQENTCKPRESAVQFQVP